MRLSANKYIFCLTLVILCGYANAGSIAKRQAGGDQSALSQMVNMVVNAIASIPLVGGETSEFLRWIIKMVDVFEIGTNGALARVLGGALPCTISLSGTNCSGLTTNGGFGKLLMQALSGVPSIILPGFVKSLMMLAIELFADPMADLLFGGVVVPASA